MSRNIGQTNCRICTCAVKITGTPYVHKFNGSHYVIADAECTVCKTKYSAWLNEPHSMNSVWHRLDEKGGFYDLSYRSTFNDEPGEKDVPRKRHADWCASHIRRGTVSDPTFPCACAGSCNCDHDEKSEVTIHKIIRIDGVQVHEEALS